RWLPLLLPEATLPACLSEPGNPLLCFEDVAVRFTDEEWAYLDSDQRALHKDVMEENCGIVASLDKAPCGIIISAWKFTELNSAPYNPWEPNTPTINSKLQFFL
uniref:KRAB domain-containing protein n=1 Tax=Podarcis muralis TaxID=64176 RepID=A0A670HU69_PODMU